MKKKFFHIDEDIKADLLSGVGIILIIMTFIYNFITEGQAIALGLKSLGAILVGAILILIARNIEREG